MKKIFSTILPVIFLVLLSSCASSNCRNDACYNRKIASVDPYIEGERVSWGAESSDEAAENEQDSGVARKENHRMVK